ncbi:MAG: PadR family transcriptional regulator [Terriglobia bacterium]|jgi:transcriptional regulator
MIGIDTKIKRGSGELAILALLDQEPLHGYEISKRIAQQTAGVLQFNLASLYPLLYRMEKRGWVKGKWEEAKSGRQRRYYHLTRNGKKQLAPLRLEWAMFFQALHRIAGVAHAD